MKIGQSMYNQSSGQTSSEGQSQSQEEPKNESEGEKKNWLNWFCILIKLKNLL